MISDTLIVALAASTIAPAVMAIIAYFVNRSNKREDWRRQDEVAARAAETNKLFRENMASTASSFSALGAGQRQIHTLVNSNLTAQMQSRKDSLERELLSLRELAALKAHLKIKPDPATLSSIQTAKSTLVELSAQLKDRLAATKKGDVEARGK